jgi:hypothetical protein
VGNPGAAARARGQRQHVSDVTLAIMRRQRKGNVLDAERRIALLGNG